jgi:DNA-binding FadR family transcriptional regulator
MEAAEMSTATVEPADEADDGGASPAMQGRVLEAVGVAIASGSLPPGSRLTLDTLQQEYGVSRTVARDTMKVLESMNLVYSRRRVGIVVQERALWNVFDPKLVRWRLASDSRAEQYSSLTELRIAVEPIAAAGAARRASAAERAKLTALAAELRRLGEAGELQAFLAADIEFHCLLLQEGMVAEVLTSRTKQGLMPFKPRDEALQAHEDVAAAVARGDATTAETAMHHILDEVRNAMGLP